ncbi:efflux RND transporter periplasmic adaptor subunit [Caldanaerobius polysaccharolyticus]|uniref:efflux RND transporter periplasmic adaptor subunit n=1 Tax=Caldanaerobius polysaccharolyticus TaxID=44256 RepID=UPI000478A1D6|nr:efflux RND transporter periplasmic adaptor subunit [Caldanaerobius polysaccharolyticus]
MKRGALLFVITSLTVLTLIVSGCSAKKATVKNEIKTVKTAVAKKGSLELTADYPAVLTPYRQVMVFAKTPGKVARVNADVGDKVNAGDVLFALDTKDIDAQLNQAKVNVDLSESNLKRTKNSLFAQQLSQAQYGKKAAQLQYDEAKKAYDNVYALYKKGLASEKDVNEAKAKLDSAKIQLDSATDNLNALNSKVIPDAVDTAALQVKQAQAAENVLLLQKEGATVTAPISGVVESKSVEVGQMVSNSSPAYVIDDLTKLYAVASVPGTVAVKLREGQNVGVKLDLGDSEVQGIVHSVSPSADARSHLFTVKVLINNSDGKYKPGSFAKIPLPSEKADNCVLIPSDAIMVENGIQFVYTVENKKIKKVIVSTGISDGKNTQITSGLREGAVVVIEGQSFVAEGETVNTVR